ncbi:hypothetical protein HMPREF1318_1689 [Actinomyces massiliensis F0489]|uniref:Uncharacterized protein n=1 Tax=Actinomyces massiliensis F0489 TaxID=1125718 RepID=J0XCS4_9ACTO|nr:hypothetical protein HMPREF1318_1689 [Actinomyces massiliensis F0489]
MRLAARTALRACAIRLAPVYLISFRPILPPLPDGQTATTAPATGIPA